MIEAGDVIHGRYEIERLIGAGGMGLIFRALDRKQSKQVALKVLRPTGDLSERDVQRFHREARLLSQLDHPHVLDVSEVGELDSGMPFLVMELLQGRDLREEIKVRERFPVDEAAGYLIQACTAVSAVHEAGIIHRDIKPQNLFITQLTGRRHLKLLDFGISKVTYEGEATLTATQGTLGTPQYMSPEQILGAKNVDERTDVWALGVILYFLLAGRLPFSGPSPSAVIAAIPSVGPPPLTQFRKDVPQELAEVVKRCLSKNVDRRYQSADALAEALEPFAPADGDVIAPAVDVPSTVPPILLRGHSPIGRPSAPSAAPTAVTRTLDLMATGGANSTIPHRVEIRPIMPAMSPAGLAQSGDMAMSPPFSAASRSEENPGRGRTTSRRNLFIGLAGGAAAAVLVGRMIAERTDNGNEVSVPRVVELENDTATANAAPLSAAEQRGVEEMNESHAEAESPQSSVPVQSKKSPSVTPEKPPLPKPAKVVAPAPTPVAPKTVVKPEAKPDSDAPPLFL